MQTRVCDTKSSFSRLPSWRAASYRYARFSRGDCFWHYFLTKHAWLLFASRRLSIEKFPQDFANQADWSGGNIPWFHGHWSQPHFPASHYAGGRRLSFVLKFKANKNLKQIFDNSDISILRKKFLFDSHSISMTMMNPLVWLSDPNSSVRIIAERAFA